MQQYFREVPWVWVDGMTIGCDVCGARFCGASVYHDPSFAPEFAAEHAEHQAPQGSLRLGDAVRAVAGPIARAMGKRPCTPCEARRRALNALRFR